MKRWIPFVFGVIVGVCLIGSGILLYSTASAHTAVDSQSVQAMMQVEENATTPFLTYQGRLFDPKTGAAKPNGSYTIQFKLYDVATGGAPLWIESNNVVTNQGLFAIMLGSTTAFDQSIFDGRALFLGISIGGDPEATPRQPIGDVAYAIYARNAQKLAGKDVSAFAAAVHDHDGAQITSGSVDESFIDSAVTRDNEVLSIVKASDGSGSGVDADTLDGIDQFTFAKTYSGAQIDQNTALAVGGQEYWFTFGYSADQMVFWRVVPKVVGAKMKVEVEVEMSTNNTVTYWLRIYNTGAVASGYRVIRHTFYQ